MTNVKILALLLLGVAVVVCILFFVHVLNFEQSAILLLGDIAAYPTGSTLVS